ncbi:starch synthase [Kribbella sp. VKM Ac-2527]|uniref:Starch synthase n=2 Tax=Kribbella caucasensis TaxID=2512215 RepID=A0A4R6KBF0_9ACTN|nr:starch synthase [Kribbella sp. VKM Ac-2527]
MVGSMKVAILTREFPPDVYGGAGVHVDFLVRELRRLAEVDVHCMGEPRPGAHAHSEDDARMPAANAALRVLSTDLTMTAAVSSSELVHSHTWYANMAGHWAKLLYGVPHVVTAHSLEPRRPWKAEQLGGGYRLSSWAERTAYEAADAVVAVSRGMRDDVLDCYPSIDPAKVHVISNGIDADFYHPDPKTNVLERLGVDLTRPYVTFVGRITRQKGVPHLLRAGLQLDPSVQLVLLAGAADTPELKTETDGLIDELKAARDGVFVVSEMLPRDEVRQVLTHALAFCCPSVYEPLGIVNLEAMACETAVVASAVGGIPEVVDDGVTGTLVRYDETDIPTFERDLAAGINELVADPAKAEAMGKAGRARAVSEFGWDAVADRTLELYRTLLP